MKALEHKIISMLFTDVKDVSIISYTANSFSNNVSDIAKEVKDIAIEFAEKCFDEYTDQEMSFNELFYQFIKEKYGTP